ncbi:MAG: DUF2490 domain-containing protein [Bacteroidota bacterium]
MMNANRHGVQTCRNNLKGKSFFANCLPIAIGMRIADYFLILLFLFFSSPSHAQQNDFGIWSSVAVSHKFTQKLSATLEEQFRFNQNAGSIAQYFTDAGVEYSLSKRFKVGVCYRFINSAQETYYSKRHRFYCDLSYKTKLSKVLLILRSRLQAQQQDIYSSDIGSISAWYSRNKITAKFDLDKKYTPYLATELFYMISTPDKGGGIIDKMRYTAGVSYEFNRVHAIDLYYILQQDRNVNDPVTDYVVGIGYIFTF